MPLLDHFSLIAPLYDRVIPARFPEKLVELAGLPTTGRLLDAAGGTGRISQTLRDLAGQVVIADLSSGMLQQAAQKDGLQAVQSHTEALPFPDEYFDRIIMVDAMHHVCSHAETGLEMWRVLKPGGVIVVEEPDVRKPVIKFVALAEKLALMRSHFIAPPAIASLFSFPGAETQIEKDGWTAWVVIRKNGRADSQPA